MPNVILMDISMPYINGIEATRILRSELPEIRIIGLSVHDDDVNDLYMFLLMYILAIGMCNFVVYLVFFMP